MVQLAKTDDRKKDTREKIQLGGLIAKAGLRYEKRALLLGLLIDAKRNLTGNPEERARLLALGEEAFRNDPQENDSIASANPADDGSRLAVDGHRGIDGSPGNDR